MSTTVEETSEITVEAIRLLFREMGIAKTLRFLNQVSKSSGDYTEERRQFVDEMSVDEIVAEIKKNRDSPR